MKRRLPAKAEPVLTPDVIAPEIIESARQTLSMERANAVIAFLLQNCHVPLRHIVAPGAMGVADPAAPNETPDGRAENRRVDVKVVVNKGVAGGM